MWEALQKACQRAGIIEHVEWHDLRRTCGCRLLQDHGFSFEEVAKWLGHADVRITQQRYAFLGVDKLHEAIERKGKIIPFGSK
jgi:integrase